ncbi:mitogen-activated protein kinase kinase kinase 7-like [Amphiura filiformis]|uniref:mitogen-activated protein kinase kinase kinase 7-like n=1 Tax=Amphiura filiformis TaxID=82378 RepID=UPI003B20BD55
MSGAEPEIADNILDPASVTYGDKIGEGGFAVVFKAQLKTTDGASISVAAKRLDGLDRTEIDYLSKLRHPNIITYFGYFKDDKHLMTAITIVTELAGNGDLKSHLRSSTDPLVHDLSQKWITEAAEGIQYLHQKGVVHRDVKSANYLLMSDNTLKLGYFGLAKDLDETMSTVSSGTVRWMAPEVVRDLKRSKKSDVYAYTIVVWEILHRGRPFDELETDLAIMTAVCDGERPVIRDGCLDRFRWIMENGWHWDYQQRPTMDEIVSILEADEGKSMDSIMEDMKRADQKNKKALESYLFHPEADSEMQKSLEKADRQADDHSKEMDELEELKRRMKKRGKEKRTKKGK